MGIGPQSVDILLGEAGPDAVPGAARIATNNTHGTGCTLSSAICRGTGEGQGRSAESVADAKALYQRRDRGVGPARSARDTVPFTISTLCGG